MMEPMHLLDQQVRGLAGDVEKLSARLAALVSLGITERLAPLYNEFCSEEAFDTECVFTTILDEAWKLAGESLAPIGIESTYQLIEHLTPHDEDFESLASSSAQNVCLCLMVALDCLRGNPSGAAVIYDFEAIKRILCFEFTAGEATYLGDSPDDTMLMDEAINSSAVRRELELVAEDITLASLETVPLDVIALQIRRTARLAAHSTKTVKMNPRANQ